MAEKKYQIIANLTGHDVFIAVRGDEKAPGFTVLTFLFRRPAGKARGDVRQVAPRHFVGIVYDGETFRCRIENPAQVTLMTGTMPDGRPCWAITGFKN